MTTDPAQNPSRGIIGLRHVIEAEIIAGREWREVVSPDGARCYVAKLRQLHQDGEQKAA